MNKSSPEHVLACLSQLAQATDKRWKTPANEKEQLKVYADKLVHFAPEVVRAACDEWGATHERWPSLGSILKLCREKRGDDRKAERLLDPNAPENFLARIKRVGGEAYDALWVRERHYLLEPAFQDHLEGVLTDSHLRRCLDLVTQRQAAEKQPAPVLSDQTLREVWAGNDRIAAVVRGNPGAYFAAAQLLGLYETMRSKRPALP